MLRQASSLALRASRQSSAYPLSRLTQTPGRWQGTEAAGSQEKAMETLLGKELKATKVTVEDISGGCGSMYSIAIESPLFKGLSLVKQHQLVKSTLKKEIAAMHGLTLQTKVSPGQ
eukprot:TRINITY_DN9246_c0_g3_i4.p1 TRINITY_DN9246_c0_g3~~TRINITY_DN9246_c0_g3_i4.p1  ORF type:complete len:136 (-),score=34.95 TRINITY_DN9246_c0_g3_i4:125-472(-)